MTEVSQDYHKAQAIYAKNFDSIKKAAEEVAKVSQDGEFHAHAQRMGMRLARIDVPSLVKSLTGEICKDWPILKQILDYAKQIGNIPFLSWFAPAIAAVIALIGPFVDMVDQQLIPLICAVSGAVSGSAAGGSAGPATGGPVSGGIQHK